MIFANQMSACKIIIIQLGRIGDAVLTTPMIKAIAIEIPDAEIYILVSRHGVPVFDGNPRIKKIFIYKKTPLLLIRLIWRLRRMNFDYWIDPKDHYSREGALLAKNFKAKIKVGYNRTGKSVFDIGIPSSQENLEKQVAERNLRVLQLVKLISSANYPIELFPDSELEVKIEKQLAQRAKKTILLNISAGNISRYWEIEKWEAVAAFCLSGNCKIMIIFKPADKALAQKIQQLQPEVIIFPTHSIKEIIALMPKVQLVITPDTSVVHIASAFNVPQIALFSANKSNLYKFKPMSEKNIVIQSAEGQLIQTISEKEVIKAVAKYLADEFAVIPY